MLNVRMLKCWKVEMSSIHISRRECHPVTLTSPDQQSYNPAIEIKCTHLYLCVSWYGGFNKGLENEHLKVEIRKLTGCIFCIVQPLMMSITMVVLCM